MLKKSFLFLLATLPLAVFALESPGDTSAPGKPGTAATPTGMFPTQKNKFKRRFTHASNRLGQNPEISQCPLPGLKELVTRLVTGGERIELQWKGLTSF
jgi:hypothetical protein